MAKDAGIVVFTKDTYKGDTVVATKPKATTVNAKAKDTDKIVV